MGCPRDHQPDSPSRLAQGLQDEIPPRCLPVPKERGGRLYPRPTGYQACPGKSPHLSICPQDHRAPRWCAGRRCRVRNGSHDRKPGAEALQCRGHPPSLPLSHPLPPHHCQALCSPGPNQSGKLQRLPRGSEHKLQSDYTLQHPALLAPNRTSHSLIPRPIKK